MRAALDTPTTSKLGTSRALSYGEDEGQLMKLRPYAMPSEWS